MAPSGSTPVTPPPAPTGGDASVTPRAFLDALPVAACLCQADGAIVHCNARAVALEPGLRPGTSIDRLLALDEEALRPVFTHGATLRDTPVTSPRCARATVTAVADAAGRTAYALVCLDAPPPMALATPVERFLAALPVAVTVHDGSGLLQFANSAAARLFGRPPAPGDEGFPLSALLRLDGGQLVPGDDPVARTLRTGEPIAGEELVAERDAGDRVALALFTTPLQPGGSLGGGVLTLLLDLAQRGAIEQQLLDRNQALEDERRARIRQAREVTAQLGRAEHSFELLVASVTDYAIYMLDRDGLISSWNAGAERIKGYRADEVIGQPFSHFYTPEERDQGLPRRALATALRNGRYEAEGWRVRKDGSRFWAHVVIDPVYEGEECVGFAKITRDVTERMHAQRALVASERRARGVIDTALDGFAQLDEGGRVVEWNPRAQAMFGWRRGEALGRPLADLILAADDRERYRDILPPAMPDNLLGGSTRQIDAAHRDGERVSVELSASVLVLDSGRLFNVFMRDITDKLLIEAQLRHVQKMDAIGKLTGGIAHDFNNLLQGVIGSLDLIGLRLEQQRTEGLSRFVEGALGSARRAAALTHRLLAFSRRQPLDPRTVEANPLILSVEALLARTMGEAITIDYRLDADLWNTRCDPAQLENALLNLAINARDAMPDGGQLTLGSANVEVGADHPAAATRGMPPGQYVCIEVADTGSGMSEEIAEHAFDPFFTTKPAGQGTGLGLSMVYGFAHQSRGFCEIDTAPGRGTRVRIYLPRDQATPAPAPPQASAETRRGEGRTVLVVEDEPVVRQIVVEVLQQLGYRTAEAADGHDGLAMIDSDAPIDLLVTDVGLPGMNGRQLAELAMQQRPGLGVLLMTGYAADAASPDGFLASGMALITKPFTTQALAERIQRMLTPAGTP